MNSLRNEDAALVYRCARYHSQPDSDRRGAKADEITLTPLQMIARSALHSDREPDKSAHKRKTELMSEVNAACERKYRSALLRSRTTRSSTLGLKISSVAAKVIRGSLCQMRHSKPLAERCEAFKMLNPFIASKC